MAMQGGRQLLGCLEALNIDLNEQGNRKVSGTRCWGEAVNRRIKIFAGVTRREIDISSSET